MLVSSRPFMGTWLNIFKRDGHPVCAGPAPTDPPLGSIADSSSPMFFVCPTFNLKCSSSPLYGMAAACPCWFKIRHVVHAIKPSQSLTLTSSNPCTPSSPSVAGSHITSMSRSFITPITTPTLSMKPLTATRSMRFVVAAYSTCSMLLSVDSEEEVRLKVRRTRGDNSASTESAACAVDARCVVGKGMDSVLRDSKRHPMICNYLAYIVQGKPSSVHICWSAISCACQVTRRASAAQTSRKRGVHKRLAASGPAPTWTL
jgi:hypothetical protein